MELTTRIPTTFHLTKPLAAPLLACLLAVGNSDEEGIHQGMAGGEDEALWDPSHEF
jgi:hypothetical protein